MPHPVIDEYVAWLKTAFRRTFDYAGRGRRMEFWSYALFAFVLSSAVVGLERATGLGDQKEGLLRPFVMIPLFVPGLSAAVRRLHDRGLSGAWAVLPFAPMLAIIIVGVGRFDQALPFEYVVIAMLLAWVAFVTLMFLPGTTGSNRYGPDPKAEHVSSPPPGSA